MRRHSSFKPLRFGGHGNPFRTALEQRQKELKNISIPTPSEADLQISALDGSANHGNGTTAAPTAAAGVVLSAGQGQCSAGSEQASLSSCMVTISELRSKYPEQCVPENEAANSNKRKFQLVDKLARSKLKAIVPEPAPIPTPEQQAPDKKFQVLLTRQVQKLCSSDVKFLPSADESAALILHVPVLLESDALVPVVSA